MIAILAVVRWHVILVLICIYLIISATAHRVWPRGGTPCLRSGMVARRSCSMPEARDGGWEEQPHVQGAVAAWAQEGLEELFHIKGREGQW